MLGGAIWALLMMASAFWSIGHWETVRHMLRVLLLYGMAATLAFPIGLFLAELAAGGKGPT